MSRLRIHPAWAPVLLPLAAAFVSANSLRGEHATAAGYLLLGGSLYPGIGVAVLLAETAALLLPRLTPLAHTADVTAGVLLLVVALLAQRLRRSALSKVAARYVVSLFPIVAIGLLGAVAYDRLALLTAGMWSASFLIVALSIARTPEHRPHWDTRFAFSLLLAALLFVGTLELGVRVALPTPRGLVKLNLPHPEAWMIPNPGFDGEVLYENSARERTWIPVRLSSLGTRGPEPPAKKGGEFRILLLGDSYTFGWGVPYEDTIGARLEDLLQQQYPGRAIRVLNGGVGGTSPWQAAIYLRERYWALNPDVVVLQTFASNDIPDTLARDDLYLDNFCVECVVACSTFDTLPGFPIASTPGSAALSGVTPPLPRHREPPVRLSTYSPPGSPTDGRSST